MQGDSGGMTVGRVDNDLGCSTMECSYYFNGPPARGNSLNLSNINPAVRAP